MKKILIGVFTLFAVFSTVEAKSNKDQDRVLIDKVAMWQVNHQPQVKHHDLEWTNAVLIPRYGGMGRLHTGFSLL